MIDYLEPSIISGSGSISGYLGSMIARIKHSGNYGSSKIWTNKKPGTFVPGFFPNQEPVKEPGCWKLACPLGLV
jgi:hypothetical protein